MKRVMFVVDAVWGTSQLAHRTAILVAELLRERASLLAGKARDVIYRYFAEVPKPGVSAGVRDAEEQAVKARGYA